MIKQLARRPGRTIAGLATVLAALGVAVGSGATFSAQTANPSNSFTSGTLLHTNSRGDGVTIVTGTNLKPGDVRSDSNAFGPGVLDLVIDQVKSGITTNVYTGDLGAMSPVALGSFASGEARTYKYTVTLDPVAATNADQAKTATADYTFTQAPS
jgi:hypothetical protein